MSFPAVAITQDACGRAYYVGFESGLFRAVPHFPGCVDEARELYGRSTDPGMLVEELSGFHQGDLALVPLASATFPKTGSRQTSVKRTATDHPDSDRIEQTSRRRIPHE